MKDEINVGRLLGLEDQEDSLVFFSIIISQNVKSGQAGGHTFPTGF
jgi:hypothetical protein